MRGNKGSFGARVGEFALKAGKGVEQTRRAICIKLFSSVILSTPVDTGRLRGNWQTTVGTPAPGKLDKVDPSGSDALAQMKDNLGEGDVSVFLTNNLPYAAVAEYGLWKGGPSDKLTDEGFSNQAPAGMVRTNVARIDRLVKQAIAEGKI